MRDVWEERAGISPALPSVSGPFRFSAVDFGEYLLISIFKQRRKPL